MVKPTTPHKNDMIPDGQDTVLYRDSRVTGLRAADHRRARREAGRGLADPDLAESVRAGKSRRYIGRYGEYAL